MLVINMKISDAPLETGHHPELDKSDLMDPKNISMYQIWIVSLQWDVTLGRYDIQHTTNILERFNQQPREIHLKLTPKVFGYLKYNYWVKLYLEITQMITYGVIFKEKDWK